MTGVVRAEVELGVAPAVAFEHVVDGLADALARAGLALEAGAAGGVAQDGRRLARVVAWEEGRRLALEWWAVDWEEADPVAVELRVEPTGAGSRVVLEQRGWGHLVGDDAGELAGWFADAVAAPVLRAGTPGAFGDWLTDRRARRPSGPAAREAYRDPLYHRPNFGAILEALDLRPQDHLLEVGCGGGALLADALRSGCRATGVDHSSDMVRVARAGNAQAVQEGRLEVLEAPAERLPFPADTFTCAAMTSVLGFLADPVAALREVHRVLRAGGRFAAFTGSPEMRGTMAAPEPMASRLRFYADEELESLFRAAGFASVAVSRPDLEPFARDLDLPGTEAFADLRGQLVVARR